LYNHGVEQTTLKVEVKVAAHGTSLLELNVN